MNISTPYSSQKIMEDVARISWKLMIGDKSHNIDNEPFYGHFFTGLVKKTTLQIDTLAVAADKNLVLLLINPTFWEEYLQTDSLKLGALKHEILHIVFKHIFRHTEFNHKLIFNVAADLVVNQYVKSEQLIKGAVKLEDFPNLGLKKHDHLLAYYNALMALYQKETSDDENDSGNEEGNTNEAWQNLKKLLDQDNSNQQKHEFWKDIEDLSSAEKDILESAVNQSLENTLQRLKPEEYSKLPEELKRYLENFERSLIPLVNWRRILRLFANSSRRTRLKNTLQRPSKRYGTNPGIKVKKKQKIMVAIDTSGSIDKKELQDFFKEIYHIWKQGSEIKIIECDTAIQKQYVYNGKAPELVTGGGGTSFEAPLQYAQKNYRPDAIVYFTDGFGPTPQTKTYCPIMWLISQKGAKLENMQKFEGRKIKMQT